ncbi:MAG: hypothetical protein PUB97_04705 [Ruminococcus sp.]|nr:hypothetical protein [Ruminococcus sp.]
MWINGKWYTEPQVQAYVAKLEKNVREAKIKAVREFADMLKNRVQLIALSVYAAPFRAVSVGEIDKLADSVCRQLEQAGDT